MKKSLLKKGISLLLTLAMLCSLMTPAAFAVEGHAYSDIHGNWAESSIERWSDYGIVQGNNGKFDPDGFLTRAQMAAILSRLLVLPEAESAGFKDVKSNSWYADVIDRCAAAGIMLGDNGYAMPEARISRQQAVVMMARALGIAPVESADLTAYSDAAMVSDYAAGYMAAMAKAGIVKGTSETTLSPQANITRAATVTILDRAIEVYANEKGMDVKAEGTGLILVVADEVNVTAPEGTMIVIVSGVQNTVVNKKPVSGGQTYMAEEIVAGGGSGGSGSSGGSGGSGGGSVDLDDLTITESLTHTEGNYQNVTIADSVGDGEVTLEKLTITGDLIIRGGGSGTIKLVDCVIMGSVIMDKKGGETPRVLLVETPVSAVEAKQPAIIEAADKKSAVSNVTAAADVDIKGSQTIIGTVTVDAAGGAEKTVVEISGGASVAAVNVQTPAAVKPDSASSVAAVTAAADVDIPSGAVKTLTVPASAENVEVSVGASAAIDELTAKGAGTTVAAEGVVNNVTAEKDITVASGTVGTVTIPSSAERVEVTIASGAGVEDVKVNSASGATLTNNGTVGGVSSDLETAPTLTTGGSNANEVPTHFHKWDSGVVTLAPKCEENGVLTYTCVATGCTTPAATKTNVILASAHKWSASWTAAEDGHYRTCEYCQEQDKEPHTWDEGVVSSAATCTEAGAMTFTCTVCAAKKSETIPAPGHTESVKAAVAPTCTATGLTEGKVCSVCSTVLVKQEVIPALGHTEVVKAAVAPTCTTTGLTEGKTCSVCSTVLAKQEVIPALGHDFSGAYRYDEAGHWHVCSRCDVTDSKAEHTFASKNCAEAVKCTACAYVKPAGNHSWNAGVVTTAPTCTEPGVKTFTCGVCAETKTETIAAKGHVSVTDKAVAATCTAAGLTEGAHCSVCSTVLVKQEVIPALGHTEVVKAAVAPTCTTTGLTEGKTCSVCSTVLAKQEVIPALGHDFSGAYRYDEAGHWHVCSRCDVTDSKAEHTFASKNCAEAVKCTACAYVKPAGNHSWNAGVVTTAPTCTESGVKTFTCGACAETKTETIAAKGHVSVTDKAVAATCTAAGLTEGAHCSVCSTVLVKQEVIPSLGHTEVVKAAVAPTCTTTGLTEGKTCSVCSTVLAKQEVIPALGHDFSDKYDQTGHWRGCSRCDVTEGKAEHTFASKNCAEAVKCTACAYVKPAGNHSWNEGVVTTNPTCTESGEKTFTCGVCSAEKKESVSALDHAWGKWTAGSATHSRICTNDAKHVEEKPHEWSAWSSDENEHKHACDVCAYVERGSHVFDGDSDSSCNICSYERVVTYPIYVRHMMEEVGTVNDALEIRNGKVSVLNMSAGELPVPEMIPGWTYKGWSFVIYGNETENYSYRGQFTSITSELEAVLKDAVAHKRIIYMDATVYAEGMGNNGFGLTYDLSSGDVVYTLSVPANADEEYFLSLRNFDRADNFYTSVLKDDNYSGKLWALIENDGCYGAGVEVMDTMGNVLAAFRTEGVQVESGEGTASSSAPVVTIDYAKSDANNIVYEISNISASNKYNYQLVSLDPNGESRSVYFLGSLDQDGKLYVTTGVDYPLNTTVELYGVSAVTVGTGDHRMTITKPLDVSAPKYDHNQSAGAKLEQLIDQADSLGLLKYLDSDAFVAGADVTRLQIAMLAAGLMGLEPGTAARASWPFNDGGDLSADEKALIMKLCDEGILAGYGNGNFGPNDKLTNATAVKILDRALGEPVVALSYTYGPIPGDHWAFWSYAMMDSIGVLNENMMGGDLDADIEDILTIFINAKNWRTANPKNPVYPAGNAHFDGTRLVWDAAALPANLDTYELSYKISLEGTGNSFHSTTKESVLRLWYMLGGEYDQLNVRTYFAGRYCGEYDSSSLKLTVHEKMSVPATVSFKLNDDGTAYRLYLEGLTPGVQFNIFLGKDKGDFGMGIGDIASTNGTFEAFYPVDQYTYLADCVKNGGYFLLREYPGWNINSNTAEMTIVNRGGWMLCADGSTAGPVSYEVSNIRFQNQYVVWDTPTAVMGDEARYNVVLSANGGVSWINNCRTGDTKVPLYSFETNTYNKIRVETWVDGLLMAHAEMDVNLVIGEDPAKAAPGSVDFRLTSGTDSDGDDYAYYTMTATGLAPNTSHIFQVTDLPENWNIRNFREVMSDSNGNASIDVWDADLVKNGYYSIIQMTSCTQTDDTTAALYKAALGKAQRCFPATNSVSFKENGEGFLNLFWDYEILSDVNDYDFYLVKFYDSAADEWVNWSGTEIGQNSVLVNSPGCKSGTYTKVRVIAMDEEENANGQWYVEKEQLWFETAISLTIGEENDAPSASVTNDGNGEYTFTISGLRGQNNSSYELLTSLESDGSGNRWGETNPTEGMGMAVLTVDWPTVGNGYYRVREFVDFTAAGNVASFDIRESDWIRCFSCGHTATNDHPVSGIRLEGSWIAWDEPTVTNPDYGYEVSLSKDGGQSWSEVSFYGGNQTRSNTMSLPAGVYNAIQIKTFLPENCCDREVGSLLDTNFSLTVVERQAATPAAVTFVPVSGKTDTYSIVVDGLTPGNWADLSMALDDKGRQEFGSYGTPNADASGRAVRDEITAYHPTECTMERLLTDGYYDLYEFAMQTSADGKTGTLTRITHGGWTKSVIGVMPYSDTAWFEVKGDGSLYFCWDMTPMANDADHDNGYSIYLNDGTNWERVDGNGGNNNFWRLNSPGMEPGTYTGIKLVGRDSDWKETSTWFEVPVSLTITAGGASGAEVDFIPNDNGGHDVEVSKLAAGAEVAELIVSDHQGLGDIDYKCKSLGGYQQAIFKNFDISYPEGYYRVREYSGLTANKLSAGFTISESAWTKLNLSGPEVLFGILKMEQTGSVIKMAMDAPEDMSNIDYFSLAFYDSKNEAASKMTGITCPKDHLYFYVSKDKFDPNYNYDTIEITAHALSGYKDTVWNYPVVMNHEDQTRGIASVSYDVNNQPDPLLTVKLDKAANAFYHIGIYNNGQLIANDSSYNSTREDGVTLYRSCIAEEQAAIQAGTATLVLSGMNMSRAEKVLGIWLLDIQTYHAECSIPAPASGGGSGDPDSGESHGEINFVSSGNSVVATWADHGYAKYRMAILDDSGDTVMTVSSNSSDPSVTYDLRGFIPRQNAVGSRTYDIVLYGRDNNNKDVELARRNDAITVTVSGDPVSYTMDYNGAGADMHYINLATGTDTGIYHMSTWYDADGYMGNWGGGSGSSQRLTEYRSLQDGDVFDLRIVKSMDLTNNHLSFEITPPSTATYEKPAASNTWKFSQIGSYLVSFSWDYEEPSGFTDVHEYILQFSEDGGTTWTNGVNIPEGENSTWLSDADLEVGNFNAMRMMAVGATADNAYVQEVWFQGAVNLTVKEEAATFDVVFALSENGGYQYTISDITMGNSDQAFFVIEFTDDASSTGMKMGGGSSFSGSTITEYDSNPYIADGYFRAAVFYDASASGNTASLTLQKMSGWKKCIANEE